MLQFKCRILAISIRILEYDKKGVLNMVDINCKTEDCMNFVTCEDENIVSVTCSHCCATIGTCSEEN